MAEKWTDADMSKFLDIYQNYSVLWNPKLDLYRNSQARKSGLLAIMDHMNKPGLTEHDLKNKIKNIRTTYNRELTKVLKSMKSGTGRKDIYKPALVWFEQADTFLRSVTEARASKSNLNIPDQSQSQNFNDDEDNMLTHIAVDGANVEEQDVAQPSTLPLSPLSIASSMPSKAVQTPKGKPMKRKAQESNALGEALCKLEDIAKGAKVEDEFDTFAKHIANQLRQLPLQRALEIQQNFQNILTRARMQCLNMLQDHTYQSSYSSNTWSSVTSPLASPGSSHYESTQSDILSQALNNLNDLNNC